ncbi:MAG: right-handed parallel beta-helix repeat-containing protein [Gammaproteobacteria bacterium]|nr:right-handed parallel beta-helix repeat-containing protein [Gammaproteobacteria bacterium]
MLGRRSIKNRFEFLRRKRCEVGLSAIARKLSILLTALLFLPFGAGAITELPAVISGELTLQADQEYSVTSVVTIGPDAIVTVEPGVTLVHSPNTSIAVKGSLIVAGLADNVVTFTSGSTPKTAADWGAIIVQAGGSLTMRHAVVEYSDVGVFFYPGSGGSVSDSVIRNTTVGIYVLGSTSPLIERNTITATNEFAVVVVGVAGFGPGSATFSENSISANNTFGFLVVGANDVSSDPQPQIRNNQIHDNTQLDFVVAEFGDPETVLDVTNNWWGTVDPVLIRDEIYDHTDDPLRPYVDFGEYADAAGAVVGDKLLLGNIVSDRTLTEGSRYLLPGITTIASWAELTIEPGVTLSLVDGLLNVEGSLVVSGESGNPVTLTSGSLDHEMGDWVGVFVQAYATAAMDFVVSEYAAIGVYFFNDGSGTVTNGILRNNSIGVIVAGNSSPLIDSSLITGNQVAGILIAGEAGQNSSVARITNNQISGNYNFGISVSGAGDLISDPLPVVNGNHIFGHLQFNYIAYNYADPSIVLDATGNWWGANDAAAIGLLIL